MPCQFAVKTFIDETGTTTGNVNQFANQVRIHLTDKLTETQVKIIHTATEAGRQVITQILWVQVIQVGISIDKSATGLGHLLAVDRHEAMSKHCCGRSVTGLFQHGWPEQRMEIDDIFANKVIELCALVFFPEFIKGNPRVITEVSEAGHVTYWRIQPDIKVFTRRIRNLETEIWRITADVPFLQSSIQPFSQLVGDLVLQGAAARPFFQEISKIR